MKKSIIAILSCLLMASCNGLDNFLNKAPQSDLSYVETIDDCNLLLNNPALMCAADHTHLLEDGLVLSDIESVFKKNDPGYRLYTYFQDGYISYSTEDDAYWNIAYKNVYYMNVILDMIDKVSGSDDVLRSQLKGEAFLNRAMYHFCLVNVYAKQYNPATAAEDMGIPIVDKNDMEAKRSRASVQEVYDFVLSDLENAIKYIKQDAPEFPENFRGTLAGAHALRARVYMNMQKWSEAIADGEAALSKYNVLVDYNQFEDYKQYETQEPLMSNPYSNIENLWAKGCDSGGFSCFMHMMMVEMGAFMGGLHFTDEFAALIDAEKDLRYKLFMGKNMFGQTTLLQIRHEDPLMYGIYNSGITTPQVHLMLAEAYARSGKTSEALDLLNRFAKNRYAAASFVPYEITDQASLVEAIIKEGRIEDVYTGRRWFEMRRLFALGEYDTEIVRYNVEGDEIGRMVPSYDRMCHPIPQKIININPNIKPNAPIK